ncbi:uncharacterized protein SPPG_02845 [Spizellomyces punctatus DAOM BR117]|uniref:BTB domain-containing protein n=1 Tax=Spizellomyces punctatus (strain DAOM BR117) TaxID=645134 RepID=A0A0L0HN64_SPIPD|nr:uncharacterized protein SPPG_02845 [Spizellomyces punctatus DAOM BR117]KND02375.1 hypothetical protein SPPG_02845 [Spizellomyces punctatus DAOM BR117]|eukprot:XP_016610414.1 hypothetical protein SPPG_02845 [Spizellomyces punctatus DAOM BR117]
MSSSNLTSDMLRPRKKPKLDSPPEEPDVARLLQKLALYREVQERLNVLSCHSPTTLRRLSAYLRYDLERLDLNLSRSKKMHDTLDLLFTVTRALACTRVYEEDVAEVGKQKAEVRATSGMMLHMLEVKHDIGVQTGALRILANLINPSKSLKIRNPAYGTPEMAALMGKWISRDKNGRLVKMLVATVGLDARECRFYALKCLVGLAKFFDQELIVALEDVNLRPFLTVLEEVGCQTATEKTSDSLLGRIDDVYVLCMTLVSELLQKGWSQFFASLDPAFIPGLLKAVRSVAPSSVPDLNPDDESSVPGIVETPDSTIKFLQHAIKTLHLICKRQPEMSLDLLDLDDVHSLILINKSLAYIQRSLPSNAKASLGTLETLRSLVQVNLLISRRRTKPCLNIMAEFRSEMIKVAIGFGMILARTNHVSILRTSLLQPILELFLCNLPQCPRTLQTAIDAQLPLMLVKWWNAMSKPQYLESPHGAKVTSKLKGSILKVLTYVLNDANGLQTYSKMDKEVVIEFHRNLSLNVRRLLSGTEQQQEDTTEAESDPDTIDIYPSIGVRSLRLFSVLFINKLCRLLLTDQGVLADFIDGAYIPNILGLRKSGWSDRSEVTRLLFTVLERAATDSNVRFKMRDGEFWSRDEGGGPATERRSSFTLIHFLLILVVAAGGLLYRADHSDSNRTPKPLDTNIPHILQRAMVFLSDNYGLDTSVSMILCNCPLVTFDKLVDLIPAEWVQRRQSGDFISVLPVVLWVIERSGAASQPAPPELELELDPHNGSSSEHVLVTSLYESAAHFLETLLNTPNCRSQLLTPPTLHVLSSSLANHPIPSLLRILSRLLISEESLEPLVTTFGTSSALEPLLERDDILIAIQASMRSQKGVVRRLLKFWAYFADDFDMRLTVAVAIGWWMGERLIFCVVEEDTEVGRQVAREILERFFETMLDCHAKEDDAVTSRSRVGKVLKYLGWALRQRGRNPLRSWIKGVEVSWPRISTMQQMLQYGDSVSVFHGDDDDVVTWNLPDDPTACGPLTFSRKTLSTLSAPLQVLLYGSYKETIEKVVTIRDVKYPVWKLFLAYCEVISNRVPERYTPVDIGLCDTEMLETLLSLYQLADKFLVDDLRQVCQEVCVFWCRAAVEKGDAEIVGRLWQWIRMIDFGEEEWRTRMEKISFWGLCCCAGEVGRGQG